MLLAPCSKSTLGIGWLLLAAGCDLGAQSPELNLQLLDLQLVVCHEAPVLVQFRPQGHGLLLECRHLLARRSQLPPQLLL